MTRVLFAAVLLLVAFALGSGFGETASGPVEALSQQRETENRLRAELRVARGDLRKARKRVRREYVARMKERRAFKAAMYLHPVGAHPLEVSFLCIYSHEKGRKGWATNTGNGYTGGLQMDSDFVDDYGADFEQMFGGGAHLWPRSVQIAVALRAFRTRGFYPWPNTARLCGLIR